MTHFQALTRYAFYAIHLSTSRLSGSPFSLPRFPVFLSPSARLAIFHCWLVVVSTVVALLGVRQLVERGRAVDGSHWGNADEGRRWIVL